MWRYDDEELSDNSSFVSCDKHEESAGGFQETIYGVLRIEGEDLSMGTDLIPMRKDKRFCFFKEFIIPFLPLKRDHSRRFPTGLFKVFILMSMRVSLFGSIT